MLKTGIPVLIIGDSGSGKSSSLRNFEPNEIGIFKVVDKPLPFRKKMQAVANADYRLIEKTLMAHKLKRYAIDDSQYLLAFDFFNKANQTGYNKFTEMAVSFYKLIQCIIKQTPPDCITYFLHHTEETATGHIKAKTIGKMLDEKLTVEGLFSIVLYCTIDNNKNHVFFTQSDGRTTAKSPMDMFDVAIPNDLKLVDETIRNYYELNK